MEFCPDCGGMMLPFEEEIIIEEDNKEDNVDESAEVDDENNVAEAENDNADNSEEGSDEEEKEPKTITKRYLKCNSCGYKKDLSADVKEEYSVEKKVKTEATVIMRGDESGMKSTVREICPKCGHDRASYELLQTRSADEAPTRFFTCENCGHKWRGYD
jgi:DNA-directed RNA polymerase subunit M